MKPDYTSLLTEPDAIPTYNQLGIPIYFTVEQMKRYRRCNYIGCIRCQHCATEFLIMCDWRAYDKDSGKSPHELPKFWDYGDPPFHYLKNGDPCIGNTTPSINEREFESWEFTDSELLPSIGLE